MQQQTHEKITRDCANMMFPFLADLDALSRFASIPDRIHNVVVKDIGAEFHGFNLCSLTHFAGYSWKDDPSLPHLELPDREVFCDWARWAPVVGTQEAYNDPLRAWIAGASEDRRFADELRWPPATAYAEWMDEVLRRLSGKLASTVADADRQGDRQRAAQALGAGLHFVQDLGVPHHRRNALLGGHLRFEGAQADWYARLSMRSGVLEIVDRALVKMRAGLDKGAFVPLSLADACRELARKRTPAVRCWAWNRTVRSSVEEAISYTVRCMYYWRKVLVGR